MKSIVLVGYMGAGKSVVASALSDAWHLPLVDTDKVIEKRLGMRISDYFAKEGEEAFRRWEEEILKELAGRDFSGVLSTGGGMVLRRECRSLMKKLGPVVWLRASADTIAYRLRKDTTRPLLAGTRSLKEKAARITEMLKKREDYYREASELVLDTDDKSVSEIVSFLTGYYCYNTIDTL